MTWRSCSIRSRGFWEFPEFRGTCANCMQLPTHPGAVQAIEIFCRTAKKSLGAFIAILGGLDVLVFTGGIGEHDADVRAGICGGLESFGIILDPQKNQRYSSNHQHS